MFRHTGIRTLLCFALVGIALPVAAEQSPGLEHGFSANTLYQFGEVDAVNTFNGNLSLRIPIGPSYPIDGGLAYGLTLTYNSKIWDYEQYGGYNRAIANRRSNGGMGWLVSLGRMIPPADPTNDSNAWIYESPDGNDHGFAIRLHEDDPATVLVAPVTEVGYTRDGTYIRMLRKSTGTIDLEFPDGTVKTFSATTGNLSTIRDRFGNFATVTYLTSATGTPCSATSFAAAWRITDSKSARMNYVCFKTASYFDSTYPGQIDKIVLAAPAGATGSARSATYSFIYTPTNVRRGCHSQFPNDRFTSQTCRSSWCSNCPTDRSSASATTWSTADRARAVL